MSKFTDIERVSRYENFIERMLVMKIKRWIIYVGITLWTIAFIQMIETEATKEANGEDIITAFAENNFLSTVSTITASGSYGNTYMTEEERESFLIELAHSLGISTHLVYDCVTEDGVTTSSLARTGDNACTVLKLITTEKKLSSNEINIRNVVTCVITFDNSLESAFYYKDILKKAFEAAEISPDITVRLEGNISGELSMSQKNAIADNLIENVDGEIVTESRKSDLFTIYAYTNKIDDYILSGSMRTNLNLIITYDEMENVTHVSMATPFFNEDF